MYERIGDEWLVSLERPMHLCRLISFAVLMKCGSATR
jgi:hypothetical protein